MEHRVTAVLVAAGSSTRMGFDKLSFDLGGETVLERSVRAFDECPEVDELVIVTGASSENAQRAAARCKKPVRLVKGGSTRAESARSGVAAAHGRLVAVHDAARPFVSQSVIADTIAAAARCGAAAPAVPVKDTIKQAKGGSGKTVPEGCMVENTPDRSTLYAVQTPQCFDRAAYLAALDELDEASARLVTDIHHFEKNHRHFGGDFSFDHNNTTDGYIFDHFTRTRAVSTENSPPAVFFAQTYMEQAYLTKFSGNSLKTEEISSITRLESEKSVMPNFEANFFFMSLTVTLSVCICRKYLQLSALIPKISVLSASSQNVSIMGLYRGSLP